MQQALYFAFLLAFSFALNAQELNWEWGQLQRNKGQLLSILADQNQQFSTIHATSQFGGSGFQLTQFEQLNPTIGTKVKPITPEGFGYYVQTLRGDQQHLIFVADRNNKEMKLFVKVLDAEFNAGEELEILQYIDPRPNALPEFNILESPDRSLFVAYYQIPGKRNGTDTYGYKIFNYALEVLHSGEYSLPYDANLSSIEDYFLTNNGEFFIGIIELNAIENQGVRIRKAFKNIHVYQLNNEGLKDYTFELEGKRISNFIMNAQHPDRLTLFGIYSNSEWDGMQDGFFSAQLNLTTDTAMAVGFLPFSSEIMLNEYRTSEQMRIQRRLERRNEDPQLSRYDVRDIFTLPDGSYVGSIEKYYVYTSTTFNNQTGQRMTTNYYYYNDIVAFCIDTNGQLRWEQRIPKIQVSINDYGPYSSYASFIDGSSLHFIFNDSKSNYDEAGDFKNQTQDVASFSLSRQRNVGAWVQIDLKSGNMSRQISYERANENILLVPKAFEFDRKNIGMYTYGIFGPQEKFGYIQLKTNP